MDAHAIPDIRDRNPNPIPPAASQSSLPPERLLTSANAGVVVERVGQVRAGRAAEARAFADRLARRVDDERAGSASVLVYEETFGRRDRLHTLLHLDSLDTYYDLLRSDADSGDQDGWNDLFVEGTAEDLVLLPQFRGMYGAFVEDDLQRANAEEFRESGIRRLQPATHQTKTDGGLLHTGNAGVVIRRTTQMVFDFRAEARQFGREVAQSINERLPGECTVFVFEEAFGAADRLHWLIHMKDLATYMKLIAVHVSDDPELREIYARERIAPERGGGTWARTFVDGTMSDCAFHALPRGLADGSGTRSWAAS